MTRELIKSELENLILVVSDLTKLSPATFQEYNDIKIQYDTAQAKLEGFRLQLEALDLIETLINQTED